MQLHSPSNYSLYFGPQQKKRTQKRKALPADITNDSDSELWEMPSKKYHKQKSSDEDIDRSAVEETPCKKRGRPRKNRLKSDDDKQFQ